ncbi:MAG: major capsid protein [Microviridae sp.]|nr:MAG: major capsid protein [Microviridae sp.]
MLFSMSLFPKEKKKPPKMAHHDKSHYFDTSMAVGPKVPILVQECIAGDVHQLAFESLVNTQALLSPLYGSFKLNIEVFFAGTSLYIPKLWRNGSMQQADGTLDANYPYIIVDPERTVAWSESLLDESALWAYLGYNPGFTDRHYSTTGQRQRNAIPILMYLDTMRHYYANRQQPNLYYIAQKTSGTKGDVMLATITIRAVDWLFEHLPANGGDLLRHLDSAYKDDPGLVSSQELADLKGYFNNYGNSPMYGLICGNHMPDKNTVILNSDFYKNNVTSVQVDTSSGALVVDQLVTAKKLWMSRNNDAITSGSFKDWIRVHYGVTPKIMDDMPTFCGSTSSEIIFEDIRATTAAETPDGTQRLGDKGSSGKGYSHSRMHSVVCDRPGYIIVLASITPRVKYYQGLKRFTMHKKLSDSFRPEFNGIGMQDVLVSDLNMDYTGYAAAPPTEDVPRQTSVGKQPGWTEYMTAVDEVRGTFCSTERSWVLLRDMRRYTPPYSWTTPLPVAQNTNVVTVIDPLKWQQPFADQQRSAQNFLAQFYIKHHVRSTVLKRLRPKF